MKNLLLELKKQKGRFNFIILLALLVINYIYSTLPKYIENVRDQGWLACFYNQPLENSMFLSIIIALFASRQMDIEHTGNTWKHLYTFEKASTLFFTKFIYGGLQLLLYCLLQIGMHLAIGYHFSFAGQPNVLDFLYYFSNTFIVTLVLYLLHLILSFCVANQALSLCVGLAGSFYGLFSLFLPKGVAELLPWGLYGSGIFIGMNYDKAAKITTYYHFSYSVKNICLALGWFIVLLALSLVVLKLQDTESDFFARHANETKKTEVSFHKVPVELLKIKHSPAWIAFILLPLLSVIIGTINYTANIEILQDEWYSLWSQHTLFLCLFFMPATVGVFCSCIWRNEHIGTNWNQLLVNVNPISLFLQKFLVAGFISCLSVLWIGFLFFACGKIVGITAPFPKDFASWIILGCLGMLCICGLQLFLSLIFHNFIIPIGIGFVSGIISLWFISHGSYYLLPYSIMSTGMRANNPLLKIDVPSFLLAVVIHLIIYFMINIAYLKQADVRTHE